MIRIEELLDKLGENVKAVTGEDCDIYDAAKYLVKGHFEQWQKSEPARFIEGRITTTVPGIRYDWYGARISVVLEGNTIA